MAEIKCIDSGAAPHSVQTQPRRKHASNENETCLINQNIFFIGGCE